MRRTVLACCLLLGVAAGGCGGGDDDSANTRCLTPVEPGIETAARDHAKVIVVGAKVVDRDADRVEVDACRTTDENATATVTVVGVPDKRIADQRHQLTLERRNAKWVVVRDLDTQRCRKGHGHRGFSSIACD